MNNKQKFDIFLFFKELTLSLGYSFECYSFEEDTNFLEGYDINDLLDTNELSFYIYSQNTSIGVVIDFDKNTWFPAYDAYYCIGNTKNISLDNNTKDKFKNLIALLFSN